MAQLELTCRSFWCKAKFYIEEDKLDEQDMICPKCKSFENLSGGITSVNNKVYEGPRNDGLWHQVSLKVSEFGKNWEGK